MKLYETFISEQISLVKYKDLFFDSIGQGIADSVGQMHHKIVKYPEEKKSEIRSGQLNNVNNYAISELFKQLSVLIPVSISYTIRDKLGIKALATSKNMEGSKSQAYVNGLRLVYNSSIFRQLSELIIEEINSHVFSRHVSLAQLDIAYQSAFEDIDIDTLLKQWDINRLITELVSITLHELTHIVQNDKQIKKGRDETEYRSYLEKDKNRFYRSIASLSQGDLDNYKIYQASPQEIAAFAQQAAYEIVKFNDLDTDPDMRMQVKKNPARYISSHVYKSFNNPSNHREYLVFKRFQKLIYQIVMDYIEQADEKLSSVGK